MLSDERIRELATRMVGDYFAETMSMGQCVERAIRLSVAEAVEAGKAELAAANEATAALRAEVERMREDAERYRWLKQPNPLSRGAHIAVLTQMGGWVASGDKCDAAIDAARKEQ